MGLDAWLSLGGEQEPVHDLARSLLATIRALQAERDRAWRIYADLIAESDTAMDVAIPRAEQRGWNAAIEALRRPLQAIAEGYPVRAEQDRYIIVEDPDFQPDNGSNPRLVIDIRALTRPDTAEGDDG